MRNHFEEHSVTKNNRVVSTLGVAVFLLALVPNLAHAQGHAYVGGTIGNAMLDDGDQFDDTELGDIGLGDLDLDDRAMALGAYGGYQFSRYFAVEGGAKSLGRYTSEVSTQYYGALTGSALGILPVAQSGFEFFGQLGLGFIGMWGPNYDSEIEEAVEDNIAKFSFGPAFLAGAGVRYTPPSEPRFTLRLGYEHYFYNLRVSVLAVDTDDGLRVDVNDENLPQSIGSFYIGGQFNF
jgi:hypothetical protein